MVFSRLEIQPSWKVSFFLKKINILADMWFPLCFSTSFQLVSFLVVFLIRKDRSGILFPKSIAPWLHIFSLFFQGFVLGWAKKNSQGFPPPFQKKNNLLWFVSNTSTKIGERGSQRCDRQNCNDNRAVVDPSQHIQWQIHRKMVLKMVTFWQRKKGRFQGGDWFLASLRHRLSTQNVKKMCLLFNF